MTGGGAGGLSAFLASAWRVESEGSWSWNAAAACCWKLARLWSSAALCSWALRRSSATLEDRCSAVPSSASGLTGQQEHNPGNPAHTIIVKACNKFCK